MFVFTQMFHELRRQVSGHSSFQSRPGVSGNRKVIDPKCDSRTKRAR
jgi:hypothetical protein